MLNHPNIVKIEELKITKNNVYIIMEYINGGSLSNCLDKYKSKYGKGFSEEIVQYLMLQIVNAIKYIHNNNIVHRDLKLDNIMVNFDNENDKVNIHMMKAKIKIIDFGFSAKLEKGILYSTVGTLNYADPQILKKFMNKKNAKLTGYSKEVDIWSLGALCYEMLIGHAVFDTHSFNDLIEKVEIGVYKIPKNLSKEVISFLNGMLQYEGKNRLNINELDNHPFLKKNIKFFTKINLQKANKKMTNKPLKRTIWSIFSEEDERQLLSINAKNYMESKDPINEENNYRRVNTDNKEHNINKNNFNQNYKTAKTYQIPESQYIFTKNFYGNSMNPVNQNINKNQLRGIELVNKSELYNNNLNNQNFYGNNVNQNIDKNQFRGIEQVNKRELYNNNFNIPNFCSQKIDNNNDSKNIYPYNNGKNFNHYSQSVNDNNCCLI